jgi:hypothetical protein
MSALGTEDVRSTSNKSGACPNLPKVLKVANCDFMSALPPKADIQRRGQLVR